MIIWMRKGEQCQGWEITVSSNRNPGILSIGNKCGQLGAHFVLQKRLGSWKSSLHRGLRDMNSKDFIFFSEWIQGLSEMLQGSYRINEDSNENYDLPSQKNECSYVHRPNIFLRLFFWAVMGWQQNWEEKYRDFSYTTWPPFSPSHCITFPTMNNLHLTIKEPTLTPKIHSLHEDLLLVLYIQWVLTND